MKGFKIKYISLNNKCKELSKAFYISVGNVNMTEETLVREHCGGTRH